MPEILEKLRPDRDLQCYFQQPSAVAALSETTATGFVVSGSWRQQFDWAVIEWNRDNVFEHPLFRNLPDGDLSGLTLSYEETRTNCIPIDSDLWDTVEWPYLRIWPEGEVLPRLVPLRRYATPVEGTAAPASLELTLCGTPTAGDLVGVAWLDEQYHYEVGPSDTLETVIAGLAAIINTPGIHNGSDATMDAAASGPTITLISTVAGANWNRVGAYGFVSGARTENWSPWWGRCSGGTSPTKWRIELDFEHLVDKYDQPVPTTAVRQMRWTYAAGWQNGDFERSEFEVRVSNWSVTGSNRAYAVAGPGSRRIEDDAREMRYLPADAWSAVKGAYNFSSGSIHWTTTRGAHVECTYRASGPHTLYVGTRYAGTGSEITIRVDGGTAITRNLAIPPDDVLVRLPVGEYGPGEHTVSIEHTGTDGTALYLDFLELAVPATTVPAIASDTRVSLATDWDTYHSLCLAPERTAWMIDSLGFHGRVNHYVGAMWFYELVRPGHRYASAQIEFIGTPEFGGRSEVILGRAEAPDATTTITHVHYMGDTADTVAKAFELEINRGTSAIRAVAEGAVLHLYSRSMGADGNQILIDATPRTGAYRAERSGPRLSGGTDGEWRTDLAAVPRLNRAARDWSRSFFTALHSRGLDAVAALSSELRHGDPSPEAGIAQRCPAGDPVIVNTPAVQTNFSPTSLAFWSEAYRDLAESMQRAGLRPYLQFGEVQWWYFRDERSGMPFYDEYTKSEFRAAYGREMRTIPDQYASPGAYAEEAAFLPTLIGRFTRDVIAYVRASFSECRFEVLYPLDVNETALDAAVNFPATDWTAATLDCLKTESFGYTYARNLNQCQRSIRFPMAHGFPRTKSAHLTGISDPTTPWQREVQLARAEGVESVVLFAVDQYCLVGYPAPLASGIRRSSFQA